MRARLCVVIAMLALSSASVEAASPHPKFYGLSSGQASSFTSSPSGCFISLLFDDFRASLTSAKATVVSARRFTIASSRGATGKVIRFDIRGAMLNAAGSTIRIGVAGTEQVIKPTSSEFTVQAKSRLAAANTPILVTLEPRFNGDASTKDFMLTVDSIDVALPECPSKGVKE
jgi:hypothetical protein